MPSRRQVLAGLGGAGAAAVAGCLGFDDAPEFSPGTDADADWPMPRFDAANAAYSPDAAAPREGVRERWTHEGGAASGTPVIADGTVYLPAADALVALDAATGDELWRFATDDRGWFSDPVVHDGTVYVASDDDAVYALDAATGDERWSRADAGHHEAGVHLLAGEHVSDPVLYAGTESGEVLRLDPATGAVTWRTDVFGAVSAFGYRFGRLYVGTAGGEVYAFTDTVDGVDEPGEGWRRKVGGAVESILPDEEGLLVDTFGGPLRCLEDGAHAGTTGWTVDAERAGSAPVRARYTFFAAGYGGLSAFRDHDGGTEWRLDGEYDAADPVAAGDTLYASSGGAVHAFALDGGVGAGGFRVNVERWSHATPGEAVEGLAVADGAVFAAFEGRDDARTTLYCLEPDPE